MSGDGRVDLAAALAAGVVVAASAAAVVFPGYAGWLVPGVVAALVVLVLRVYEARRGPWRPRRLRRRRRSS